MPFSNARVETAGAPLAVVVSGIGRAGRPPLNALRTAVDTRGHFTDPTSTGTATGAISVSLVDAHPLIVSADSRAIGIRDLCTESLQS